MKTVKARRNHSGTAAKSPRAPGPSVVTFRRPQRAAPLADQLYEAIVSQIVSGKLTPGMQLPKRTELEREYNVSPLTLQRALQQLLDDPTAAIDPETEHEILEAMDTAIAGRTTFVVAHRLSTLRRADFIVVLEDGKVVQRGTHEELMRSGGHYLKAAELQTADQESLKLLEQFA